MLKDKIKDLFKDYPKEVQLIIAGVLKFEQENITNVLRPFFAGHLVGTTMPLPLVRGLCV